MSVSSYIPLAYVKIIILYDRFLSYSENVKTIVKKCVQIVYYFLKNLNKTKNSRYFCFINRDIWSYFKFYNYINCFATSAAKSSSFFSIPSPVSKRTNFAIERFALFAFAISAMYPATVCFPSSAFT